MFDEIKVGVHSALVDICDEGCVKLLCSQFRQQARHYASKPELTMQIRQLLPVYTAKGTAGDLPVYPESGRDMRSRTTSKGWVTRVADMPAHAPASSL